MDISRLGNWFAATSAYKRGDARELSKFIKTHGVSVGIESEELATLLLSKQDPRKETKPETVEMLSYVRSEMRTRELLNSGIQRFGAHIERVSARLALRGWSTERIGQVIRTRYNWSTYPIADTWRPDSNDAIFERAAARFRITVEGVKKSYERDRRQKNLKLPKKSSDTI
jgi:hypothetical protein